MTSENIIIIILCLSVIALILDRMYLWNEFNELKRKLNSIYYPRPTTATDIKNTLDPNEREKFYK